jgi:hypothetical protein
MIHSRTIPAWGFWPSYFYCREYQAEDGNDGQTDDDWMRVVQ